jgi:hypothetical protein
MRNAARFLIRPISTKRFDERLAQFSCYLSSLLILVLGIRKLCSLGLDEMHLLFGLLLILCLTIRKGDITSATPDRPASRLIDQPEQILNLANCF